MLLLLGLGILSLCWAYMCMKYLSMQEFITPPLLLGLYLFSLLKIASTWQGRKPRVRFKKTRRFRCFHRRKLPHHIVMRCRRRHGQRPRRLDGSYFWSTLVNHKQHHARLKDRSIGRRQRKQFRNDFIIGAPVLFKLNGNINDTSLDNFCKSCDFLKVPRLIKATASNDRSSDAQCAVNRLQVCQQVLESTLQSGARPTPYSTHLVWDTGASCGLTPFRSDFIDYMECKIPVKDVTKTNYVIGIGTTLHRFIDTNRKTVYLPCLSYHLPSTDIRLFSPQTYHQLYGGHSSLDGDKVVMHLENKTKIKIPVDKGASNLPILGNTHVPRQEREEIGSIFRSALAGAVIRPLDVLGSIPTKDVSFEEEFYKYQ